MIAFVLQSARKNDFAIANVREGAAGGQMLRLSKEFESVNSFDNRSIWPPAAPSLTFAIAESFFRALCNTNAIIGLS